MAMLRNTHQAPSTLRRVARPSPKAKIPLGHVDTTQASRSPRGLISTDVAELFLVVWPRYAALVMVGGDGNRPFGHGV